MKQKMCEVVGMPPRGKNERNQVKCISKFSPLVAGVFHFLCVNVCEWMSDWDTQWYQPEQQINVDALALVSLSGFSQYSIHLYPHQCDIHMLMDHTYPNAMLLLCFCIVYAGGGGGWSLRIDRRNTHALVHAYMAMMGACWVWGYRSMLCRNHNSACQHHRTNNNPPLPYIPHRRE